MQQAERRSGRVGDEVIEDVRAVGEGAGEKREHRKREGVDSGVVALAGRTEVSNVEAVFCRPDVGTHEEPLGKGSWVQGGNVGADVETLGVCRYHWCVKFLFFAEGWGVRSILADGGQCEDGKEVGLGGGKKG